MGRGRAKAKQTKVARELKYNTGNPDLDALQAELSSTGMLPEGDDDAFESEQDQGDRYAQYYDETGSESDESDDDADDDSEDSEDR